MNNLLDVSDINLQAETKTIKLIKKNNRFNNTTLKQTKVEKDKIYKKVFVMKDKLDNVQFK